MAREYDIPYKFIKNLSKSTKKSTVVNYNDETDEQKRENLILLARCSNVWMSLQEFRDEARRMMKYRDGKQWSDLMDGYDDFHRRVTEEEYIISQGKVPLKNNLISSIVRTIVGVFRSNKTEPEVIARNEDNPKAGEMLSVALQYAHQICDANEVDAEALSELAITGFCCQMIRYDWVDELNDYDITLDNVDRNCIFFTHNFNNGRQNDVNLFGMFEDLDFTKIVQKYARNSADVTRLSEIYKQSDRTRLQGYYSHMLNDSHYPDINFTTPVDSSLCRVIHVWEKVNKECLYCHDRLNGTVEVYPAKYERKIIEENAMRINDGLENGLDMDEIQRSMLITYRYKNAPVYHVKHLTPRGDVLWEGDNPYWHNGLPFVFLAHPFHDGEIHSFVGDFIDQQRYINRLIMMIDFMMSASAKSLLIFPTDCLGEMTKEEVVEEYIKTNGVVFARMRPGAAMPTELSSKVNYMGATELLNIQLQLINRVSGVHESMQGQSAKSGTAASLYAQESQNSASNILDLLESFNAFRCKRDEKMLKTIQQYYKKKKFLGIVGTEYTSDMKWYDPDFVKNIKTYVALTESTATPAYRMAMNNMLMQMLQMQAISAKTMLQGSTLPYKDKILKLLEKEQEEAMAMQAGQQQQHSPELLQMQEQAMADVQNQTSQDVNNLIQQSLQ